MQDTLHRKPLCSCHPTAALLLLLLLLLLLQVPQLCWGLQPFAAA
jgi:hypothetical protein